MVSIVVGDGIHKLLLYIIVYRSEDWQHPFLVGQIPGKLVDKYKLSVVVWLVVQEISEIIDGPEEVRDLNKKADGRGGEHSLAGNSQCWRDLAFLSLDIVGGK